MKELILLLFASQFFFSCNKTKNSPNVKPLAKINPFSAYLIQNASTSLVSVKYNGDTAREIGYSFTVADTGTIYALGLRMPDTTHSFMVSLWDSLNPYQPLLQVPVKCNSTTGFTYQDVTSQHEEVHIQKNRTYIVSVNLTPVGGAQATSLIFGASNNSKNPFSFMEGPVTYHFQYYKYSKTPVCPNLPLVGYSYVLGLVDIGFENWN